MKSKSLLNSITVGNLEIQEQPEEKFTFNSGFEGTQTLNIQIPEKSRPENSIIDSTNSGFGESQIAKVECKTSYIENPKITIEIQTGFDKIEQEKLEPDEVFIIPSRPNPRPDNSILEETDTGFGGVNTLIKDCPKYKVPLLKENFLSEFKGSFDKVRNNLEVYSKQEILNLFLNFEVSSHLVTKDYLDKRLTKLDFTTSVFKTEAEYQIPESLFKK